MKRENTLFPCLELFLNGYSGDIADRISITGGTIEVDCYEPDGQFDGEAWEEHMVLVTPKVLTRESFKEAYRLARIIAKAFKAGVDAVLPTRTRIGDEIQIELRPDAPFKVFQGTAISAGWLMEIQKELTAVLNAPLQEEPAHV